MSEWAHFLHTTTDTDFTNIVNALARDQGPPCLDSSSMALITPDIVHHFTHGNYQGTMKIPDFMSSIFNLIWANYYIALLHQPEIDQLLRFGEAPRR